MLIFAAERLCCFNKKQESLERFNCFIEHCRQPNCGILLEIYVHGFWPIFSELSIKQLHSRCYLWYKYVFKLKRQYKRHCRDQLKQLADKVIPRRKMSQRGTEPHVKPWSKAQHEPVMHCKCFSSIYITLLWQQAIHSIIIMSSCKFRVQRVQDILALLSFGHTNAKRYTYLGWVPNRYLSWMFQNFFFHVQVSFPTISRRIRQQACDVDVFFSEQQSFFSSGEQSPLFPTNQ